MPLPTSAVEICNIALSYLREPRIASIETPTTSTERLCALHYDDVRQYVLSNYCVWNFAKGRETCTRDDTATPDFDYTDAYTLPEDFIRYLSVEGDEETEAERDYDLTENYILLNNGEAASVSLRYIKDIEDVTLWRPGFRRVVCRMLALELAYNLTGKEKIIERLEAQLKQDILDAITTDGQERVPRKRLKSKMITGRRIAGRSAGIADQFTHFD